MLTCFAEVMPPPSAVFTWRSAGGLRNVRQSRTPPFRFKRNCRCQRAEDLLARLPGSLVESTVVSDHATEGDVVHVPQRLTIGTGHVVVTHLLPKDGILVLGRAPEATIRVDDASVSRLHVRLHL